MGFLHTFSRVLLRPLLGIRVFLVYLNVPNFSVASDEVVESQAAAA